jgi:hypothetical protein
MKRRFAFLALVLGFTVLACQIIAGIDRVGTEDRPPPPPDVYEAAPPIPDPCAHSLPPLPPATDDEPSIDKQLASFHVALSEFHLLARNDAGALLGFDLDGVCTCDDRPATAHDGGPSCAGPVSCDLDGGIDNGSKALFDKFGTIVPDIDKAAHVNESIMNGQQGTLIEISNYNGFANDRAVNVGIVISNGLNDGSGCGTTDPDGGLPPYPPGWCGNDIWTVDPRNVIGDRPPYAATLSAPAYVTNHKLVINDPLGYFEVPFGDVALRLYSPIVVATIVPLDANGNPRDPSQPPSSMKDGNFRLDDGILAGRMSATTILAATGALRVPGSGDPDAGTQKYFCQSSSFGVLTSLLCGARDIASSTQVDFQPKAVCDALSATTSFQARPAKVGDKFAGQPTNNACIVKDGGSLAPYQCP